MILQLNPMIPVVVTSKDNRTGYACLVTEHGEESYKIWTVIMDDSGEVWDVPNPEILVYKNWTMGRRIPKRDTPPNREILSHCYHCSKTLRDPGVISLTNIAGADWCNICLEGKKK